MFGGGISGTRMREIIANDDFNSFAKYIPLKKIKNKKEAWSIMTKKIKENFVDRDNFVKETILRESIRKIISKIDNKTNNKEDTLRKVIQNIIAESEADRVPHASTAINFLEDLLKSILPGIEQDYKSLTTKKEQRDAFRSQLVSSVNTAIETANLNVQAAKGDAADGEDVQTFIDIEEDIEVNVVEDEDDKFIDIDPKKETEEEEEEETVKQDVTANETGSKLAAQSFDSIEKQILESYNTLSDEEDRKTFQDYLVTNLKLYFDKWEKELGEVIEPTTTEYEDEKDKEEAEEETAEEAGDEDLLDTEDTEDAEDDEEEIEFDI